MTVEDLLFGLMTGLNLLSLAFAAMGWSMVIVLLMLLLKK